MCSFLVGTCLTSYSQNGCNLMQIGKREREKERGEGRREGGRNRDRKEGRERQEGKEEMAYSLVGWSQIGYLTHR